MRGTDDRHDARAGATGSRGSLIPALAVGSGEHIALVGGGGKTSLLFALAEECRQTGGKVITTTTTKVWHREALRAPCTVLVESDPNWRSTLREGLQRHGHAFLAGDLLDTGKVQGISPLLSDGLFHDRVADYLLVEADGASGRPVKAHADHEPVIPETATLVVALLGVEAIGRPMTPEVVFRMERFEGVTGCRPGQGLSPQVLVRVFLDPRGLFKGTPARARRVVFLNKWDLLEKDTGAHELARLILEEGGDEIGQVVIGSIERGQFIKVRSQDEGDLRQDTRIV